MSKPGRTVLFTHPSDELYGSDRCLLEAVRSLESSDRAIVVLPRDLPYRRWLSEELEREGADVRSIDMLVLRRRHIRLRRLPQLIKRLALGTHALRQLIRRERVDLIHTNTLTVPCGAIAARITRTPHLWHIHEHIGDEPLSYRLMLQLMLRALPGLIIANSKSVAHSIAGRHKSLARRIRVVRNGVSPQVIPVERGRAKNPVTVIGVVGRLAPRKGIQEALEAAAMLVESGYQFELRFYGGPPPDAPQFLENYRDSAERLRLGAVVRFEGEVDDIASAYAAIGILLVPSQRPEPFGLAIIEGMLAGLPVVVTRNEGGSDELLEHGRTGLYCGRSPASMAETLKQLLDDPALGHALGREAAQFATRRYTIDRYHHAIQRAHTRALQIGGVEFPE